MLNGVYPTHAEMLNDIARYILGILAALRMLKEALGFGKSDEDGEEPEA